MPKPGVLNIRITLLILHFRANDSTLSDIASLHDAASLTDYRGWPELEQVLLKHGTVIDS